MASTPQARFPRGVLSLASVNHEPGGQTISGVVRLLNAVVAPFSRRDWRQQHKLPATGGVIIVANHISNFDPIVIGQYVAYSGRWPRFLAKASIFSVPVVGAILRRCGQIPVQRQTAQSRDALVAVTDAVAAGRAVVVYPEGTITGDPELWPMVGKTGAARIALQTGCPVIPMAQWGAQDVMYGRQIHFPKLLPRKTFRVITGDPVLLDDLRELPVTTATLREGTERIMAAITTLVAQLRDGEPPAVRFDPRTSSGAGDPR